MASAATDWRGWAAEAGDPAATADAPAANSDAPAAEADGPAPAAEVDGPAPAARADDPACGNAPAAGEYAPEEAGEAGDERMSTDTVYGKCTEDHSCREEAC